MAFSSSYSGRSDAIFKRSPFVAGDAGESVGLQGQFLNTLDVELIAGLEQYMPTPAFRLRIAHARLMGEIRRLRAQVTQYERLPDKTPDMQERLKRLKRRLNTLEYKERRVVAELGRMLTLGSFLTDWFGRFKKAGHNLPAIFRPIKDWIDARLHGSAFVSATHATEELRDLQEILSSRLADPNASFNELGRIISAYDRLYARAQRDMNAATSPGKPKQLFQTFFQKLF